MPAIALPVALVLLLGFLLASVPARHSEIWRHLATGRALFDGTYTPGTDPFAYTTADVVWVNHAWLYDGLLYAGYRAVGTHLVVFNAVLALILAGLMLLAAGIRNSPWTTCFSVALALVALGPYLTVDPALLSCVLLAFTLWQGRAVQIPE